MRGKILLALAGCLLGSVLLTAQSEDKLRVLIIDGQNNHQWKQTTPVLKSILEKCGRFSVEVATTAPKGDRAGMARFQPDFSRYQAVLLNYNGEPWPSETQTAFEKGVREGKFGLVIIHAANNAFTGWDAYNRMIGMGWRGAGFGERLTIDDKGKEVRQAKGVGLGSGHRYTGPFAVTIRDASHPITKGMPREWMHAPDELYDNMRGPIENVRVLATAYSDRAKKGTGEHEPMIWTVSYGKGRVFHTPMGHDVRSMQCVGFAVTVQRGTEWAATGKVTVPIPDNFPTEKKASTFK